MDSATVLRESLALDIVRNLRAHGHKAYLVGGCVRDRLLGIAPKDFDIGTDTVPERTISLFPGAELIGAHFGVVMITRGRGVHVEVATFRSESAYIDGRRPAGISFETDPALDARRRDFTINGLM
ncbi:MAG: CCA tRNA nucleotidyltransferase, partial [Bryobacteraceae bacterium]